jgi:nucleoside-diphosphate-sugar epimerase
MMDATTAVCQAAREQPVERIIHISSMAVYGQATGQITEDAVPEGPLGSYARSKQACEEIIERYVQDGGRAYILRPGCVFGPGSRQWTTRIARLLAAGRIGDLGGAGDGICNLTYIDDLTSAIIAAISTSASNGSVFNIASDYQITWNDFFLQFGRALGAIPIRRRSSKHLTVETRVIAPILRVASLATRAIPRARNLLPEPITPSLVQLWRQEMWMDTSRAVSDLGLNSTPLEQAVRSSASWFREPHMSISDHH